MILPCIHWIVAMIKSMDPHKVLIIEHSRHSIIVDRHYFVLLSQQIVLLLEQIPYLSYLLLYSQCLPTLQVLMKDLLYGLITPFLNDPACVLFNTCCVMGTSKHIISHDSHKWVIPGITISLRREIRFREVSGSNLGRTAITWLR